MMNEGQLSSQLANVLIVDDDEMILSLIKNHIEVEATGKIETFVQGRAAWQAIEASTEAPFDLFIIDWKLRDDVSGLALFNRLRATIQYRLTPILAISGTIEPEDFRLIDELPCTGFLAKPFSQKILNASLYKLLSEHGWYKVNGRELLSTLAHVAKNEPEALVQKVFEIIATSPNQAAVATIAAQHFRSSGRPDAALQLLGKVIKLPNSSLRCLNEYGKTLLELGRHEEALKVLSAASKYSPKHLERLCLIGTAELNLGDPKAARESFRKALAIDKDTPLAQSGATLSQVLCNGQAASLASSSLEYSASAIPHSFASLTNTTAIAKVRSGDAEGGIDLYRQALKFITEKDVASKIAFNIGLAYIRQKQYSLALPWIVQAEQTASTPFLKAKKFIALLRRVGKGESSEDINAEGLGEEEDII